MDQTLKAQTPTIDQQIDFVRGARHLVTKGEVTYTEKDNPMLMAIEETLLAAKNWQHLLTKVKEVGDE
jgi:hypothetical protein